MNTAQPTDYLQQTMNELEMLKSETIPFYGTFFLLSDFQSKRGSAPPYPCLPPKADGAPVYALVDGIYLVDDSAAPPDNFSLSGKAKAMVSAEVVRERILALVNTINTARRNQEMALSARAGSELSLMNEESGAMPQAMTYSAETLWLEINEVSPSLGQVFLTLHGTEEDQTYELLSREQLENTNGWTHEGTIIGQAGQTATAALIGNRTNQLFFWTRSWADADGNGLPDWWELQYFGMTDLDPYDDPDQDGWTNLQEYQNGTPPKTFNTPPAPQGVVIQFNATNGLVVIDWQTSPGMVTGYTVERADESTQQQNVTSPHFSETISTAPTFPVWGSGPLVYANYRVQGHYINGSSAWSEWKPVQTDIGPFGFWETGVSIFTVPGPQGVTYLVLNRLPPDTVSVHLSRIDVQAHWDFDDASYDSDLELPITAFTNGLCPFPAELAAAPVDGYGYSDYNWFAQAVNARNRTSQPVMLEYSPYTYSGPSAQPFLDGRVQLKQNLNFLLRVANREMPFEFYLEGGEGNWGLFSYSSNYVYASFFNQPLYGSLFNYYTGTDTLVPFRDNYLYRNWVFSTSDVSSDGRLTNGIYWGANLTFPWPSKYSFLGPVQNGATITAILSPNESTWTYYFPFDASSGLEWIGVSRSDNVYSMEADARNIYGLPFLSAKLAYGMNDGMVHTANLLAGGSVTVPHSSGYIYPETAQPQLETVEYYFTQVPLEFPYYPVLTPAPGEATFSVTNTSPLLIAPFGDPHFKIAGWAKQQINNGYAGKYAYLGQYFDKAYTLDANGQTTTTTAGVLSEYGNFFPTQPGPAALITLPDLDTGERGTGIVHVVKLQLDVNHDGEIDLGFAGPDNTSAAKPFVFWANNDYDRLWMDDDDGTNYEDSVTAAQGKNIVDCNFKDAYGNRMIPTVRDLEDYTRLWICGVDSNLVSQLPSGTTITLSWGDVANPNSGNPTIDLFKAVEPDGGIGYLTNAVVADDQANPFLAGPVGRVGPGQSLQLYPPLPYGGNYWPGSHFIWCGVSNGTGALTLTISQGGSNTLAQTTTYIQIVDIKQMYERWTLGDRPSVPPLTNALPATEEMRTAFKYDAPTDTNTPYILFVHGWNMNRYDKDRFAETAFKRLYWQGYHGRFGGFRWPTDYGFKGTLWKVATDSHNYDNSELTAWKSAAGLVNKLNDLNAKYPGHVYLLAHSMGNVVAGEALRLAGANQIVNTYIASQAAVPTHVYDSTSTNLIDFTHANSSIPPWMQQPSFGPDTPNIYGDWLAGNSAAANRRINFYNANDFALSPDAWCFNQELKPDYIPPNHYYYYSGGVNDASPWNHFIDAPIVGGAGTLVDITIVGNRYTIMAYAAEARSRALGATADVVGLSDSLNLTTVWPVDTSGHDYKDHFWHSAQFRGRCWEEWTYWNTLLRSDNQGFNIQAP